VIWELGAYLVVDLTLNLVLGVVALESLETINTDVEVGDLQDYVRILASFVNLCVCGLRSSAVCFNY